MIKLFFKGVRLILGAIIVTGDKLIPPKKTKHTPEHQSFIDQEAKKLTLYEFRSCPFCIKVRRKSRGLNIPLQTRNVLKNPEWHQELVEQGGQRKVPCLKIENADGEFEWMYESKKINRYLDERFAA